LPLIPVPRPKSWRYLQRITLTWLIGFWTFAFASTASAISITTKTIPAAVAGTAYSTTLVATGGTQPYTWKLQSGGFPGGLSLNTATGVISGMPAVSGSWEYSYPFSVYIVVKD